MFPAIAVGVLAAVLVLQCLLPRRMDLPEPELLRPFRLPPLAVASLPVDPMVTTRSIFDPLRGGGGGGGGGSGRAPAPVLPVGGATAAGVVDRGGRSIAFLLMPDGRVTTLAAGSSVAGWRLLRIENGRLVFRRGRDAATLPLGGGPTGAGPGGATGARP